MIDPMRMRRLVGSRSITGQGGGHEGGVESCYTRRGAGGETPPLGKFARPVLHRTLPAMIIGVPKEIKLDEYRVAMLPVGVEELTRRGHRVLVEHSAGLGSGLLD